jgi:hypothetical protein
MSSDGSWIGEKVKRLINTVTLVILRMCSRESLSTFVGKIRITGSQILKGGHWCVYTDFFFQIICTETHTCHKV